MALAATSAPGACAGGALFATPGRPFDREPPVITFATPAEAAYLRGTFEVFASAVDNLDGTPHRDLRHPALIDDDTDGHEVHDDVVSTALPDGPFAMEVRAVDDSGNAATATRTVTITTPPRASRSPARPPTAASTPAWSRLGWTVTEANPQGVTATLDGAPVSPGSQVANAGAHTLVVTATDRTGATATATRAFFIDNTPPVITTVVAPTGAVVRPPITITATATDNLMAQGSLGSALAVTGAPPPPAGTPGAPADGSRTLALTYATAADGPLAATFTIADRAGNAATPRTVNLTVDQTNPILTWSTASLTLVGGTYWTSAATVTLTGTATDSNLAGVSASWPGGSATATLAGASWTIAGVPAPSAGHAVAVRATDLAGNFIKQIRTVRSDVTPPVVDFTTTTVRDERRHRDVLDRNQRGLQRSDPRSQPQPRRPGRHPRRRR
ncbi:MAG: hypothetical protein IPH07_24815 [Deltaproteobacteria bacterium]|nr:hypothetical protein [Deltaproteobacteria bacterium]